MNSRQKYNIITIDIEALTNDSKTELNLCKIRERRKYVISEDAEDDCPLFFQLQKVLGHTSGKDSLFDEDSLKCTIIYADFKSIFNNISVETENHLKNLFKEGIFISFNENDPCAFMPFDKSNSMSRDNRMTFVKADLIEDINKRLLLDIDFYSMGSIDLSKFYAYKGLYLSSSVRIDPFVLNLNSEKLVVIKDSSLETNYSVTVQSGIEEENTWLLSAPEAKPYTIDKLFDGEGLVSKAFYTIINNELKDPNGKATSFQIRMPFIKGMLHYVDFHRFLNDYSLSTYGKFIIKDAFGIERDLMKAEIIIPVSMFKCYAWIEKCAKVSNNDPIDLYFNGYTKYAHSLYIANTNITMGKSLFTRLNYQFLNTLKLSEEDLSKLIDNHISYIKDPQIYVNNIAEINPNGEFSANKSSWQTVLEVNNEFVHERTVNNHLKSISDSLKKDIGTGHIIAEGTVCYLSRDLIFFLIELVRLCPEYNGKTLEVIISELFGNEFLMPLDYFYIPNCKLEYDPQRRSGFKSGFHYPVFRNPHLSRNEQSALRFFTPSKKSIYNNYLGHLKGLCMVAYSSVDPQALGGADFDGDLVKVFSDDIIRGAVLKGAYKNYKRCLPLISIPSLKKSGLPSILSDQIEYEVIKNTFSNKIGQISNLAIRLGQIEYNDQASDSQKECLADHSCAECTLLTGLEIDAAKTGVHPNLSSILKVSNQIKKELQYDYIADFKEKLEDISSKKMHFSKNNLTINDGKYTYKLYKASKNPIIQYCYSSSLSVVNMLPKFFFDNLGIKIDGYNVQSTKPYFDFMTKDNWKSYNDIGMLAEISEIIASYNQLTKLHSKALSIKELSDTDIFESSAKNILKLQYDDPTPYYSKLYDLFSEIDDLFEDIPSINAAIDRLKNNSNWFFSCHNDNDGKSEKESILKTVLNIKDVPESKYDFLYNYEAHGYFLLYFILSDALNIKINLASNAEIFAIHEPFDEEKHLKTPVFTEMLKKYNHLAEMKTKNWQRILFLDCVKGIDLICSLHNCSREDLMPIMYSLTSANSKDSNGKFFWNYFSRDELKAHINPNII